jgi:hypothetical protein
MPFVIMIAQRIHVAGFQKHLARVILGCRQGGGGGGQCYDRRWFTAGPVVAADAPTVPIRFIKSDGSSVVVDARVGESLLQTSHRCDVGLEGACEGGTFLSEGSDSTRSVLMKSASSVRLLHVSLNSAAKAVRFTA